VRGCRVRGGAGGGGEQGLGLVDVLAVRVEDRLAHLVGRGALRLALLLLVGEQHDDLAVRGKHLLELADDVAGRRHRRAGGARRGDGVGLLAATVQPRAGEDGDGEGGERGEKAGAHGLGRRAAPRVESALMIRERPGVSSPGAGGRR
jgi:hypothetical protein